MAFRAYVNSKVNIYTKIPDVQTNASEGRWAGIKNGRFIRMLPTTRINWIATHGAEGLFSMAFSILVVPKERVVWRTEARPRGSSQKIPALVLRVIDAKRSYPE
jgi:Mg-chelatase subunit ChlD